MGGMNIPECEECLTLLVSSLASFSSSSYRPCPRGPRPSARSTSSQSAGGEGARQRHLHWQSAAPTAIVPCQLMAEQHTFHHCNHARKQTGELVAMLVEEPLLVNPSGRLDFLLRAHPPSFSPPARPKVPQIRKQIRKQANLESGDTQEAALSHWDHERSRAGGQRYPAECRASEDRCQQGTLCTLLLH